MRRLARPLLYLGTIVLVVGLGRYHAQYIGHYYFHSGQRLPWNLTYAALLCLAAYGVGLPDLDRRRSVWGPAGTAVLIGAVGISIFQLVLGSPLLPRFVIFAGAAVAAPWFAVCAAVAGAGRDRQEDRDRVIVVAGPEERATFRTDLEGDLEHPAALVAALCPEEAASGDPRRLPLIEAVLANRGTLLVLDRTATEDETVVAQAATMHEYGLRVRSLSAFYDEWIGKLPMSELERMSLMFDVGEVHRLRYGRVKRGCDLLASAAGLLLLVVVIPVVWVGNVVANRGPLFYRQKRVGQAGRVFEILKFRTMSPGGEAAEWTALHDDRITPWGRVLRRTHLDELPQVLNILRGEQSVVGPRPEQPQYVAQLRKKIAYYDLRHIVRPGLTGWAQVKYPYGASELDALEKLQYDFYYLSHQGLGLDVRIVGRTLRSVIGRFGR